MYCLHTIIIKKYVCIIQGVRELFNMPKVSIIMPTYNVEKYLEAALESVVNQTFSDIEVICINDGSTDNSLQILENYAKQDNRIKLINQQNQGVSVARNNGIEAAAGEYIMFLDPDDTYDLKLCEKVVQKIDKENPDIVMWGHNSFSDGEIVKTNEYVYLLNKLERNLKINLKNRLALQIFIWDKAFKKEFLDKNNIRFPAGIKNAEDIIFCLLSYYAKPRYSFIPESLYFYTQYREDAATNKDNCIQNDLTAYKYLCTTDEYKNISQKLKTATTNHILGGAIHYWRYAASEPLKQRYKKDIEEFLEYVKGQFVVLELARMSNYRKLKHLLFKYRHKKFFDKFDIRTTDTEKTYVLFGKKFRVKRWTKLLRERLANIRNEE